jgi:alkyldihydroxyacetonephosphate synthase
MLKLYYEFKPDLDYSRENLRWNGWGSYQEDFYASDLMPEIIDFLRTEMDVGKDVFTPSVPLPSISISKSKFTPKEITFFSAILDEEQFQTSDRERILHSAGRSYYDTIRLNFNLLKSFVDGVAYPVSENQITKVLDYCNKNNIVVIPFGGGSSVVGGVEVTKGTGQSKILSLDLTKYNKLVNLNTNNRTATFQSGIYGPHLEQILNKEGFTLGHFPQSFVYSTLGGWIAARSAGQQSNRYGKIEDLLVSAKLITPSGIIQTGDYPASSSGPDWNHIIAGSEGLLGIISEVTIRIHELPEKRYYTGILFPSFHEGKECIREIKQSGIPTSMMRLSDEEEARLFGTLGTLGNKGIFSHLKHSIQNFVLNLYGLRDKKSVLIIGLEGDQSDIEHRLLKLKEIISKHKGFHAGTSIGKNWIKNRFNMPFLRNHIVEYGFGVDTMETSAPYDKLEQIRDEFHTKVRSQFKKAKSLCHISHSYENGASLYFTVIFALDAKKPIEQWFKLKRIASELFLKHKASASHHHGIGMDHKEFYQKEFGKLSISALQAMKSSLDKKGIMNPKKVFHG